MTHPIQGKHKLLNRVRRLGGQMGALERALEADAGCTEIMQLLATVRGAINGVMAEIMEDHIRMHMIDAGRKPSSSETRAANELVRVLKKSIQ